MDITAAIAPLLTQLWFLLPLLLIATLLKTAWFKGMVGEWFINLCIRLFLDKREYRLLKDVTLPTPQGSTQIDHVIVSRFGLFVIETKNMKGWIFGNPTQKSWTQQIYRRKHSFQNPLHQNHLHMMTLKSLLGLSDNQLHSVIFFIGDCTFKTPMPQNVMNRGLIRYVKGITTPVLAESEVAHVVDTIQQGRLAANWQTHRQHVTQLKTRHADPSANHVSTREPVRQSVANPPSQSVSPPDNPPPICPRCGSTMVLRTAGRGDNKGKPFWGCHEFPTCRGTRALMK
ncbi:MULTISPECIES: nuclease-related domain-containing protein [Aeromonas]|jgi:restriction system protein|uniref:Nuclease-related domain-containing protein n=1 Tax=Aeromonas caviae TaxID=648 RepID=A0ABU5W786_AERCA|nr:MULTISPECIES: nuclease-related domain-containing protein [Aeromonas]MBP6791818.1 NERD domain-containing protein [Aeromonas sp.]MBP4065421.1 NERD domain-containing protein [Aeromonas sp. MaB10011B]MBP4077842.1 NERD domain-containing protein [Aeromonas sp. MrichA-1]MBP8269436.1 NERD domain-containing protein [Aeromonas sp.]MCR3937295.1 NERD domain-containing protein [Aeromonas caviae]